MTQLSEKTTGIKFYHEDQPSCIYTRDIAGVIHWEDFEDEDTGFSCDGGTSEGYADAVVASFLQSGTWILVEDNEDEG